ncbi:MAG: zinc-binding dehydrogenase [Firmicutes bacterium]|nr:zinc-binding dehydrogenase [Bacillota bacterium]
MPLGHKYVGMVKAVGSGVQRFHMGDRVTGSFATACGRCWECQQQYYSQCRQRQLFGFGSRFGNLAGTQAEWARIPNADATLIPVPPDVEDADALLVGDILSTAYFAVERSEMRPGDTVAVVGLGPVGLLMVHLAYLFGVARVLALDTVEPRLIAAARAGAELVRADDAAVREVRERTGGRGADVVLEAVGREDSLRLACQLVRGFGTVSLSGAFSDVASGVPMDRIFMKDLTIRTGIANVRKVAPQVMALLAYHRLDVELFSHRLPLKQGFQGYELFARREAMKVLLTPE